MGVILNTASILCLNDVGLTSDRCVVTVKANENNQEAVCSFSADWLLFVQNEWFC